MLYIDLYMDITENIHVSWVIKLPQLLMNKIKIQHPPRPLFHIDPQLGRLWFYLFNHTAPVAVHLNIYMILRNMYKINGRKSLLDRGDRSVVDAGCVWCSLTSRYIASSKKYNQYHILIDRGRLCSVYVRLNLVRIACESSRSPIAR